jgi:FlaA1/EpsC-like NDP-sugar epimerase
MSPGGQHHIWPKMTRLFDLVFVCATFLAALAVSSSSLTWLSLAQVLVIRIKVVNLFLFLGYLVLCSAVFSACGLYRSHRLSGRLKRLYEIFLAVTVITGVLWLLRRPLDLQFATEAFLLVFWFLDLCTLVLSHELARWLLQVARLRGRNLRNIIIVGEGQDASALASRIRQEGSLGYRVLRVIEVGEMPENGRIIGNR